MAKPDQRLGGGIAGQLEVNRIEAGDWWHNETFQNQLTALVVYQPYSDQMEQAIELLDPNDMKPAKAASFDANPRWLAFEIALEHYQKSRFPIGVGIGVAVEKYGVDVGLGKERLVRNAEYCGRLKGFLPETPSGVLRTVTDFKRGRALVTLVDGIVEQVSETSRADPAAVWNKVEAVYEKARVAFQRNDTTLDAPQWPEPLAEPAYYGLGGDIVRAIGPHTEADPAALLVQFLMAFGNVIGRRAHWRVESTRHYLNMFAVLVGATSKARKGTSLDRVLDLFEGIDPDWLAKRRLSGLSTGEGLINAVRDPALDKDGTEIDPGESDKRLLITEPEFARVLKVGERDAATLPSILRDAWDRGELRTMTKNSPLCATGAHISMIAHITEDELRRALSDTNRANGFANRFLWVCVKRSKSLPLGGRGLSHEVRSGFTTRLANAVRSAAKFRREILLGKKAKTRWCDGYAELSAGARGVLGATTDRGEAQVRRLACLYALLDEKPFVYDVHLRAALEVWRYCFDSARFLFGTRSGDPVADTILMGLRQRGTAGMSRNEIRAGLFQQNKSSETIGHVLQSLQKRGLIRNRSIPSQGAGRPTEQWYTV